MLVSQHIRLQRQTFVVTVDIPGQTLEHLTPVESIQVYSGNCLWVAAPANPAGKTVFTLPRGPYWIVTKLNIFGEQEGWVYAPVHLDVEHNDVVLLYPESGPSPPAPATLAPPTPSPIPCARGTR